MVKIDGNEKIRWILSCSSHIGLMINLVASILILWKFVSLILYGVHIIEQTSLPLNCPTIVRYWHDITHPWASCRYLKLRVAHALGLPGTFSPPPRVNDPDRHHSTCVTQVPWCTPGSLTSGFLWSRWRGNYSRNSRRMRNPLYYVSGKRPIIGKSFYYCGNKENDHMRRSDL